MTVHGVPEAVPGHLNQLQPGEPLGRFHVRGATQPRILASGIAPEGSELDEELHAFDGETPVFGDKPVVTFADVDPRTGQTVMKAMFVRDEAAPDTLRAGFTVEGPVDPLEVRRFLGASMTAIGTDVQKAYVSPEDTNVPQAELEQIVGQVESGESVFTTLTDNSILEKSSLYKAA